MLTLVYKEWHQKLKTTYFSLRYTQALYGSDAIRLVRVVQCFLPINTINAVTF